eukprot:2307835-Prymnesium_polylepis.1
MRCAFPTTVAERSFVPQANGTSWRAPRAVTGRPRARFYLHEAGGCNFSMSRRTLSHVLAGRPLQEVLPVSLSQYVADTYLLDALALHPNRVASPTPNGLGLQWINLGNSRPKQGQEILNARLSIALKRRTEFDLADLDSYQLGDLRPEDFIKSGTSYFQPVGAVWHVIAAAPATSELMGQLGLLGGASGHTARMQSLATCLRRHRMLVSSNAQLAQNLLVLIPSLNLEATSSREVMQELMQWNSQVGPAVIGVFD